MRRQIAAALAALALAAAPALAQAPKSGGTMKSGGTISAADRAFAHEAAVGGLTEVELGNLAKEKASSADVKQFGERMATDHGKANDELKSWAQSKNVTLPTELDAKHTAVRDRLSKLSGEAFDKAYMKDMVQDHEQDVAKFRQESKSANDPDLKAWAGNTLPTLEDHLKMAQDTASKVAPATSGKAGTKK